MSTTATGHPEDNRRAFQAFLWDSYWGGERYQFPTPTVLSSAECRWSAAVTVDGGKVEQQSRDRRFTSYLVPFPAESDRSFELRWQLATYVNVPQVIVDAYAEAVTCEVDRQLGPLEPLLADDADGRGNAWSEVVEDTARWTAVFGEIYTVVDAPRAEDDAPARPRTRGDELADDVRPYCVTVHPTGVAWRDVDERGRLTCFAYVEETYLDPRAAQATPREVCVREWRAACPAKADPGGWRVLEGTIPAGTSLAAQRASLEVEAEGPLPPALNGRIPVVVAYYKRDSSSRLPRGESLIGDAAKLARTIYNKRSWEEQIAREAGFPTLAIPQDATGGKLPSNARVAIGTSKAIGFGGGGPPQWIQPSAEWAQDLRASCMQDFQLALRSAGLELAADASAQVQSGEALRIRSRDFESRAKRFARHMQRWERAVLKLYAAMAGVSDAEVRVTYPPRYTLPDLAGDLARVISLLRDLPIEIGAAAKLEAAMQAVNAALTLPDDVQATVRAEIARLLAADLAEADAAQAQRMAGYARPPQDTAPPESADAADAADAAENAAGPGADAAAADAGRQPAAGSARAATS